MPVAPAAAGDEHALGHQRLAAVRQVLGHDRQGVQPRVAERLDLAQQHRRLGQTDLQDPRAFAAAGQDPLLALGLGRDDRLLGLLAGPGQLGLALVLGDLHLHLRVGQLASASSACGLGLVQRLAASRPRSRCRS